MSSNWLKEETERLPSGAAPLTNQPCAKAEIITKSITKMHHGLRTKLNTEGCRANAFIRLQ